MSYKNRIEARMLANDERIALLRKNIDQTQAKIEEIKYQNAYLAEMIIFESELPNEWT